MRVIKISNGILTKGNCFSGIATKSSNPICNKISFKGKDRDVYEETLTVRSGQKVGVIEEKSDVLLTTGNNVQAKSLYAKQGIILGDNNTVTQGICSKRYTVKAGDNLSAQRIKAKRIFLDDNANVESIEAVKKFKSGNGLKASSIVAEAVELASVSELNTIELTSKKSELHLSGSIDVAEPIKVYLDKNCKQLTIVLKDGIKDVLDKFQFFTGKQNKKGVKMLTVEQLRKILKVVRP